MIGTTFANRYQVTGRLGEGANDVWDAFDTNQQQRVALKTFRPGAPSIHAYGEASILTALEGEHVLRVYNADVFDDIPYIATRVAGLGSTEGLRKANPRGIPADIVVSWIRQALVGLGACHDRGLVHRDIKPDNIFLDNPEFALLGDFGLAHTVDGDGSVPEEGTPHTISPEMWATGQGSFTSDVYSMGVTAYRLLTGRWPIDGASRDVLREIVPRGRFERLRDVSPQISRRLADRIEKAMSLDPADRYRSWRDMHADLGRADLVPRAWRPMSPHAGHDQCWTETRSRGAKHEICVVPAAGGLLDVEVRHATGARQRIHAKGRTRVEPKKLRTCLKDVFDHL